MKNIIFAIIVIFCVIVGGAGGHFLKNSAGAATDAGQSDAHSSADAHKKPEKSGHDAPAPKKNAHGEKSHGSAPSSDVDYFKFSREFVVPIIRDGKVASLIILNINLEVDGSLTDELFSLEPKIRDNIMTTLIQLSNDGSTLVAISDVQNYESIRATLLMNLGKVVPSGIRNVLIVDMGKQDL